MGAVLLSRCGMKAEEKMMLIDGENVTWTFGPLELYINMKAHVYIKYKLYK